ncbi:hypothetical protein KKE03_03760, partial [Patescibacteria group bacterium]|nr:hypothetical protein [Patescibacteria group bacterium]
MIINKKVIIVIIILLTALSVFLLVRCGILKSDNAPVPSADKINQSIVSPNDKPQIVSTKPDPLEDTIIPATATIEITFNRPLENVGEFKLRMEPKIDYKIE